MRSAADAASLNCSPCIIATNHAIWKASGLSICLRCGAYAEAGSVLLSSPCLGVLSASGRYNVARVFDKQLHPEHNVAVEVPVFWQRGAVGKPETVTTPVVSNCSSDGSLQALATDYHVAALRGVLASLGTGLPAQACAYGRSSTDADRFADAVPPQSASGNFTNDLMPSLVGSPPDDPFGHGLLLGEPADAPAHSCGLTPLPVSPSSGAARLEALRLRIRAREESAAASTAPPRRRLSRKQPAGA